VKGAVDESRSGAAPSLHGVSFWHAPTVGRGETLTAATLAFGEGIDTGTGLTPTSGMVMSTRSGGLDPGPVLYVMRTEDMSVTGFEEMMSHASGLGVSKIGSDLCDLPAQESDDARAVEAVALFRFQAGKWTGCFAAARGVLDTFLLAGGIGESAVIVRWHICDKRGFLGVELDENRNMHNVTLISANDRKVAVRVIQPDAKLTNARSIIGVACTRARQSVEGRQNLQ